MSKLSINAINWQFTLSLCSIVLIACFFLSANGLKVIGLPLLALLPVVLTMRSGTELDFAASRYRSYHSVLGMRSGQWKNYRPEHQLVRLFKRGYQSKAPLGITVYDEEIHFSQLFIMDPSHVNRVLLHATTNGAEMKRIIEQITENSTLQLAVYNPVTRR